MAYRDFKELEKLAKEKISKNYNITPNFRQSLAIFVSFISLTCCLILLAAAG